MAQASPSSARSFFNNSASTGRRTSDLFANTAQRGGRGGVRNPSTNLQRLGPTVQNQNATPDQPQTGPSPQGTSGPVSYTHLTLPTSTLCRSRWSPYH